MNRKTISKTLMQSCFDPKKPGPMKIVADINNIHYFLGKAVELITTEPCNSDNLMNAISVLALARIKMMDKDHASESIQK